LLPDVLSIDSLRFFLGDRLLFLSCKATDDNGLPPPLLVLLLLLLLLFRFRFLSRRFKNFFSSYLPWSFSRFVSRARWFVLNDTIREASSCSSSIVRSHKKLRWISAMLDGPSSSLEYSKHQEGSMSVVEATIDLRAEYSFMIGSSRKSFGE
jgi:MYXO-CTERM domain-containing protein